MTAAISPTATGSITNTATVSPPVGVTDPNSGNNSATDVDTLTTRIVRIVSSSAALGSIVNLPVELDSLGNENALGFSVIFNPALLSNPQAVLGADATGATLATNPTQAASGRFGVGLLLPAGQKFAAGKRQVVILSFTIVALSAPMTAAVEFADQPVKREVVDPSAVVLPAAYAGAIVTILPGLEGDVSPRPNGSNELTIADWVQTALFVAGIDTPAIGNEFQRADTAPKSTKGDGSINVLDLSQTGRYVIGLDPPTSAGGPSSPIPSLIAGNFLYQADLAQILPAREVRVVSDGIERGQNGTVTIEFFSLGTEKRLQTS